VWEPGVGRCHPSVCISAMAVSACHCGDPPCRKETDSFICSQKNVSYVLAEILGDFRDKNLG
jgi:hypothetical protein